MLVRSSLEDDGTEAKKEWIELAMSLTISFCLAPKFQPPEVHSGEFVARRGGRNG